MPAAFVGASECRPMTTIMIAAARNGMDFSHPPV